MSVGSIAVVKPADAEYSFLNMGRKSGYTDGNAVSHSPLRSVVRGKNGLYRLDCGGGGGGAVNMGAPLFRDRCTCA